MVVMPLATFFNVTFLVFIAIIGDTLNDLNRLRKMLKIEKAKKMQQMRLFRDIIKDFSSVKEFLSEFNEILEFNIASLFLWSILSISSMLLCLQTVLVEW